jgi:hypothetical protein
MSGPVTAAAGSGGSTITQLSPRSVPSMAVVDAAEGVWFALVGEDVQVYLRRLDLAVAHSVHHGFEVCSAGGVVTAAAFK